MTILVAVSLFDDVAVVCCCWLLLLSLMLLLLLLLLVLVLLFIFPYLSANLARITETVVAVVAVNCIVVTIAVAAANRIIC